MGIILHNLGYFKIRELEGKIELNLGNSVHLHVGGLKITMNINEFSQFACILKNAEKQLKANKGE